MMSDSSDDAGCIPVALDNNAEHFVRMMHGLHKLKKERVLCDVTLIAEGVSAFVCFFRKVKPVGLCSTLCAITSPKLRAHLTK